MKKFLCSMSMLLLIIAIVSCSKPSSENIIEVTAKDFSFEVADSIPSGWNTFRFTNTGHAEHFFLLNYIPDSISFQRYRNEASKPFEMIFDSLKSGATKEEAGGLLGTMLPAWYFTEVKQMGGTGIVSMHQTAQVTMNLKPGTYVMECYIKEKGVFHTAFGMIRPITVTDEISKTVEPTANLEMTLTNFKYDFKGEVNLGKNVVAVHFKEHPQYSLGNDVHLVSLSDSTEIDEIIEWLDWMNIEGLQSPGPAMFLGGTQEMPVGYTSYFTVDLKRGKYAWIAETTASKGMIHTFTIE